MPKLSIVIPYLQEFPQVLFTLRSIHEQLKGEVDHEILAIDNLNKDAKAQLDGKKIAIDKGHEHINAEGVLTPSHIKSMAAQISDGWLKYIHFEDHFSLWQARNCGIQNATGDFIMFVDAHCVPGKDSILNMFRYYSENWETLNGSIHLPLTYHILEDRKLMYRLVYDEPKGLCQYSFMSLTKPDDIFEVPCMSACGMMCHKSLFKKIGLFPQKGIYSGGEHFFNFTMALLGMKKWIYSKNKAVLHHHGDKRDYNYTWDGYQYNRAVSCFMFGGEKWLDLYISNLSINDSAKQKIKDSVISNADNLLQRDMIQKAQVCTIEEWATKQLAAH